MIIFAIQLIRADLAMMKIKFNFRVVVKFYFRTILFKTFFKILKYLMNVLGGLHGYLALKNKKKQSYLFAHSSIKSYLTLFYHFSSLLPFFSSKELNLSHSFFYTNKKIFFANIY